MPRILISAGDASGQEIAASLVRTLRSRRSDARFAGLVGEALAAEGVEAVADQADLAVGGGVELVPSLPGILRVWRRMGAALERFDPDLVVLVDSGGFHLPFARRVRRRSRAPILYAVPPQVWAWRSRRVARLAASADRIASIFPFERAFFEARGVVVDDVGHPILDGPLATPSTPGDREAVRTSWGIDASTRLVGLFPGSRRNEVGRHLPVQLAALDRLRALAPEAVGLEGVVVRARSIDADQLEQIARSAGGGPIRIVESARRTLDALDVALTKPGTVTLELAMRACPMVVIGRVHPLTAFWVGRSLEAPFFSLPNLILGEAVVPELVQGEATADRIAAALAPLLWGDGDENPQAALSRSPAAERQVAALRRVRDRLGEPGAIARLADIAEEMLGTDRA